jgi:hypothetical protein
VLWYDFKLYWHMIVTRHMVQIDNGIYCLLIPLTYKYLEVELHSASQKTTFFIITTVKTLNLTNIYMFTSVYSIHGLLCHSWLVMGVCPGSLYGSVMGWLENTDSNSLFTVMSIFVVAKTCFNKPLSSSGHLCNTFLTSAFWCLRYHVAIYEMIYIYLIFIYMYSIIK